jgi:hypothetical protein
MKDRYLKFKLLTIAVLLIIGMTVDYRTEVIIAETPIPQADPYFTQDALVMAQRGKQ